MDSWLVRNAEQVVKMFEEFDEDGESIITYDDFKSGNLNHFTYKLFFLML